eukprot:6586313-Ditylum_brightwellii.AAC.1
MSCWDKYHGFYLKHGVIKIYPKMNTNKGITFAQVNRSSALCKKWMQALHSVALRDLHNHTLAVPK